MLQITAIYYKSTRRIHSSCSVISIDQCQMMSAPVEVMR